MMISFMWGAVVGSSVCMIIGGIAGWDNLDRDNYRAHLRTEWSAWCIIFVIAIVVAVYSEGWK